MKAVAAASLLAGLLGAGAANAGPVGYDGRWAVLMVTESGVCDRSNSYVISVEDGRVRYVAFDTDAPPSISGRISSSGSVDVAVQKGPARAGVVGRLQGTSGSGTWRVDGGLCSGRWTAQKRGPVQASR